MNEIKKQNKLNRQIRMAQDCTFDAYKRGRLDDEILNYDFWFTRVIIDYKLNNDIYFDLFFDNEALIKSVIKR